jgi:hypothetical protein
MIIIWIAVALCVVVWIASWVGAIIDMNRRADISTLQIVLWIAAIVLFPILGLIAYLMFRPSADKIRYKGEEIA